MVARCSCWNDLAGAPTALPLNTVILAGGRAIHLARSVRMSSGVLSGQDLVSFDRDGYLLVRQLFDAEEMAILLSYAQARPGPGRRCLRPQGRGRQRNAAGLVESRRRRSVQHVLAVAAHRQPDGRIAGWRGVSLPHQDDAQGAVRGRRWEWHQDYGYWYHNGCLFPLMASCLIAVDHATRANGCLQVIRGSHHMGRIDHGRVGEQTGADMERVDEALKRMDLEYIEAEPGDALFFHSNLLHRSDQNRSENPRWSLICCYNAARNDPYKESRHPRYEPLAKVNDTAIKDWAARAAAQP